MLAWLFAMSNEHALDSAKRIAQCGRLESLRFAGAQPAARQLAMNSVGKFWLCGLHALCAMFEREKSFHPQD